MDTRERGNNEHKIAIKDLLLLLRFIPVLIFLPFILLMMLFLGWVFKVHSQIPEDLDSQRNPEKEQIKLDDSTLQEWYKLPKMKDIESNNKEVH